MKAFLVCVVLIATMATATAQAAETNLRTSDKGLLGAMQRMGCGGAWLSTTMRMNGILESELRRLPEGKPLVLPEGCEHGSPSAQDRRASSLVLVRELALKNQSSNQEIGRQNAELVAVVEKQEAEIMVLTEMVDRLKRLHTAASPASTQVAPSASWQWVTPLASLMAVIAILGWFWYTIRFKAVVAYRERQVPNYGKLVTFKLAPVVYHCEEHKEPVRVHNLAHHVKVAHISDRLEKKISPGLVAS